MGYAFGVPRSGFSKRGLNVVETDDDKKGDSKRRRAGPIQYSAGHHGEYFML